MLLQQRRAGDQRLHRQPAVLQNLQHRFAGSQQALVAQTHHQQIHI
jgi:hypothetical protein